MKTSEPTRAPKRTPKRNDTGLCLLIPVIGLLMGIGILWATPAHAQTVTILRDFVPSPAGNGRAVAFNGVTTLYYTLSFDANIYTVTTGGMSPGAIPLGGRTFSCGALAWDPIGNQLWCGSYDGSSNVYTVDPATGVATLRFNQTAFGGIANDSCYGGGGASFIDGLAFDPSDGTIWLSGDGARTLYHVTVAGGSIGAFPVPTHPSSGTQGCNAGIAVASGGFLLLALQTGPDQGPHVIVRVTKSAPSTVVDSFVALSTNVPGIEGLEFDGVTFAPLCAVWSNQFGTTNHLTAYEIPCADVAVTKTGSPNPVAVGNSLTYTATATNNGPAAATGVTLSDTLPSGATLVSATPSQGSCTGSSSITCALGTLASGASVTVTIVVTPTVAGVFSNRATVSGNETDPNPDNNAATALVTVVAPMVQPVVVPPIAEDTSVTITLTATDSVGTGLSFIIVFGPAHGTLRVGETVISSGTPIAATCLPVTEGRGFICTARVTYTPDANYFNSPGGVPDSFAYAVTDGSAISPAVTVPITVNAVNDAPTFNHIENQTVTKAEPILIGGVSPGANETEPVTLTAALNAATNLSGTPVDSATLITGLAITPATGTDSVRTLTYQRVVSSTGTTTAGMVTIRVTATDQPPPGFLGEPLSVLQDFTITLLNASTPLTANATGTNPPASPAGFALNEPIVVNVAVTFPDLTAGQPCIRIIRPDPYNVVPITVDGQEATRLLEAGGLVITDTGPNALPQICPGFTVEQRTFSIAVPVSDWYPELLATGGTHEIELRYVSLVQDPEGLLTILNGTAETSVVVTKGSQCSNSGANVAGTGCPFADRNTVTLHTVTLGGSSTTAPLAGIQVRVFDRNSPAFQAVAGSKNPDGSLYGVIFEADPGRVGACITDLTGVCFAGEMQMGDYLVIVKFVDPANGDLVYVGRPKSSTDFVNGVAEKNFQIIKVFNKQGQFQGYRGGSKIVVTGSILEMIVPDSAVWDGTQSVYPFIFASDSDWTVDVCAQVPLGYAIVGVYDANGNLVPSTACVQTIVANQTVVVAFEVVHTGSPEPELDATVTVHGPHGKSEVHHVKTSDIRRHTFEALVHEAKVRKK